MKKIFFILCSILLISFSACKKNTSKDTALYQCPMACEGDKTYEEPGSCPVCNMDLEAVETVTETEMSSDVISETSIFNLTSTWTTQNGEDLQLEELKGDVLVMVMIYTSCKAACPRLVADMRNIEAQLPKDGKDHLKMVFVSIDPKTDSPERLKAFAEENVMDTAPWLFLRSSEDNTREFAAVMAVNYKKISPLDFSHSNIISVFNQDGEMVFQQEGLGVNSDATVEHIKKAIASK
ncbi:protein SCO1/2 [Gelidibacter algens]|uniref:Protein SCO1/2 n=1 Tax=Gelidibacter algens TaxID=49280 RepID=A0A1A7R294_9FLAO|nr:SCO family protein [Gelidibacter algens]OBX25594.1 photosynthetic protein synthase I [Gelidibacter algens]RAJ27863.1 protein SCO1/2 [Gelidibacter algens]